MGGKKGRRVKYSLSSSCETEIFEDDMELEDIYPTVIPKNDIQKDYNRALYSLNKCLLRLYKALL